jgi:hypothetical protein
MPYSTPFHADYYSCSSQIAGFVFQFLQVKLGVQRAIRNLLTADGSHAASGGKHKKENTEKGSKKGDWEGK